MTQQELDALRQLADAATPGPWEVQYTLFDDEDFAPDLDIDAHVHTTARVDACDDGYICGTGAEPSCHADAAFIAAARAAVPALLAEVERLNGERSFLMAEIKKQDAEVERLRADNAQLQQQRHAAREDAYRLGVEEGLSLSRGISNERDALRAELADVLEIAIARGDSLGYESMDYCARLEQLRPDSEILAA